jgi:hypothetical protein
MRNEMPQSVTSQLRETKNTKKEGKPQREWEEGARRMSEKQIVVFTESPYFGAPEKVWNARKGHSFTYVIKRSGDIYLSPEPDLVSDAVTVSEDIIQNILRQGGKVRYIVFEKGGGYSNTGSAQIVCGTDGSPLKPLYVRRKGHLACGTHAAFAVWDGQAVVAVYAYHHRGDYEITLYLLEATIEKLETYEIWHVEDFDDINEVLPAKLEKYKAAIQAAMSKASCYHCRSPHYILTGVEK